LKKKITFTSVMGYNRCNSSFSYFINLSILNMFSLTGVKLYDITSAGVDN